MPGAEVSLRRAFVVLCAGSLLTASVPLLLLLPLSELAAAAALALCYTAVPLLCLFLPMYASRNGVERYLSFFPPAACYAAAWFLLRLSPPRFTLPLGFALGILGSTIGQEKRRRTPRGKSAGNRRENA